MKILFLSNLYPPHVIGGYEALCQEVVESLERRGHQVSVLTSAHGYTRENTAGNIHRLLSMEADLQYYKRTDAWSYPHRKKRNLQHLRRLIEEQQPDIVFIWGLWNMSKSLAVAAERLMGSKVVYYLASPWPIEMNIHQAYWDSSATSAIKNVAKRILRITARMVLKEEWENIRLQFEHAPCCSIALRDQLLEAGIPLKDAPVIYEGVALRDYIAHSENRAHENKDGLLSLVYVGMLGEHKGVHTAIEALIHLSAEERKHVRFMILGKGHPHYEKYLGNLVHDYQLTDVVTFHAPIPRNELAEFLSRFEVLLLPSIWSEPLARIMQEGMASGMVVVGSATGGTAETIIHGENGLLFTAGNAAELAEQLKRLLDNPQLRRSLAEGGRKTAEELFDINKMVDELEEYLFKVLEMANVN